MTNAAPAHSKWSASGFEADMLCPGKKMLEAGKPNTSSKYAAEGTAAHQVLTWALQESRPAAAYIGRVITTDGFVFEVDDDMAGHVQVCIDYVQELAGADGIVFADIRVNYAQYLDTPELEAWGTADVIIARSDELIVMDFKYGMGVEVSAGYETLTMGDGEVPTEWLASVRPNPQMALYGLGALQAYQGIAADFTRVRLAISQPRIKKAASEYDLTVEELEAWGRSAARSAVNSCKTAERLYPDASEGATTQWFDTFLRPGEKQCKFCKAKATCPALRAEVRASVSPYGDTFSAATPDEFADIIPETPSSETDEAWLAACLSKVDLIEDWCKAVRAETERRLLAGDTVPGYKLVQGKRGARQWTDTKAVEDTLKSMRLKESEMYDFKLISPASADKLAKAGTIGPRQWPKLQELITQSEGKPHVAPVSDSRPALTVTPVVDDFTDVTVDSLA